MKPIDFPERNIVYGEGQKEYQPLYAYTNKAKHIEGDKIIYDDPQGNTVACWKLSFIERLRLLFTGKVWVCLLSFHKPLTPSYVTTKKEEVLHGYAATEEA